MSDNVSQFSSFVDEEIEVETEYFSSDECVDKVSSSELGFISSTFKQVLDAKGSSLSVEQRESIMDTASPLLESIEKQPFSRIMKGAGALFLTVGVGIDYAQMKKNS